MARVAFLRCQLCGVSSGRHAGNLAPVGGALYMHGAGPGSGSAAGFGSGSIRLRRKASGVPSMRSCQACSGCSSLASCSSRSSSVS